MKLRTPIGAVTALALGTLAVVPGASAQEITLRAADSFPTGHYIAENLVQVFMDTVNEKTGGKVAFEYFPAQQLGKAADLLSLTQSGVTDIGYVGPSYVSDKMPLSSVGELPEAFHSSCEGTKGYWEIAKPGGVLDKAEFAPNGVRLLMAMVLTPYNLVTSGREITGLDSIKGLKIRSTGGAKELAVLKIGGVPVQMPAPEVREALSRGTIDGGLFPNPSIMPYGMEAFLEHGTQGINFGSFVATYVISTERWNTLSPETQEIMTSVGEAATMSGCEVADGLDKTDKNTLIEGGVVFADLPEAEAAEIAKILGTVSSEWAANLDAQGKNGTEILEAFRAALANPAN